jgi:acetoin utilization protein AcuB
MKAPVVTVRPEVRVGDAAALMRQERIRHLPVVEDGGGLVGIVTDRDLRQVLFDPAILGGAAPPGAPEELRVREIMTWGVITVRPGSDVREAAYLMRERKIGALPVVDGGRLVGILTEDDVLRAVQEFLRGRVTTVRPMGDAPRVGGEYEYGFAPLPSEEPESDAPS